MLLRELFRPFQKKLAQVPPGRLLVFGELAGGERSFAPEDLRQLPPEHWTDDVGRFKAGFRGRAVRLAGLLESCKPRPGPLYLNAASRDGRQLFALWLAEVAPLGWIVCEPGPPLQLVLPGFDGPRACIDDLALLEVSSHAERERE